MSEEISQLERQRFQSLSRFYQRTAMVPSDDSPIGVDQDWIQGQVGPAFGALRSLALSSSNWDEPDTSAPTEQAIERARLWLEHLALHILASDYPWFAPHVSDSADGGVMFEWWFGEKKVTVYVWENQVAYIQVWGPDMRHEMCEGVAEPIPRFMSSVWSWLVA